MLRRHGPAVAATLVLAGLISGVVISAATPVPETNALPKLVRPIPEEISVGANTGQEIWFHWAGTFAVRGNDRVIVTGMELIKVQPGLSVVRMRAANTRAGAPDPAKLFMGRFFVGPMLSGPLFPKSSLNPVTNVVLAPGVANEETYFVAGVTAAKPGTYHVSGWRIHYRAGGLDGVSTYEQRLKIRVS